MTNRTYNIIAGLTVVTIIGSAIAFDHVQSRVAQIALEAAVATAGTFGAVTYFRYHADGNASVSLDIREKEHAKEPDYELVKTAIAALHDANISRLPQKWLEPEATRPPMLYVRWKSQFECSKQLEALFMDVMRVVNKAAADESRSCELVFHSDGSMIVRTKPVKKAPDNPVGGWQQLVCEMESYSRPVRVRGDYGGRLAGLALAE